MSNQAYLHFPDTTAVSDETAVDEAAFATFRNSVGMQFGFFQYSGLSEEKAIAHICNAAERLLRARAAAVPQAGSENLREIYECEKCDLCEDHYAPRIVGEEKSDGGTD